MAQHTKKKKFSNLPQICLGEGDNQKHPWSLQAQSLQACSVVSDSAIPQTVAH